MGLDMYLERMPRYNGATAKDVRRVENYLDWIRAKFDGSEYAKCSFVEWCRCDDYPSHGEIEFYSDYYKATYSDWDVEKKHPWWRITEEVGYWRKANQIHNWFVENIQDGVDDCDFHREVTKEDLEELLDVCHEVLCNHDLAEARLPSTSGFFFGSTEYDEYYFDDIEKTIDIITKVLETTDFETQMLYYCSSW